MSVPAALFGICVLLALAWLPWQRRQRRRLAALQPLFPLDGPARTFFEGALGPAWIKDCVGRFQAANPDAQRIFGCGEAQLLGHTLAEVLPQAALGALMDGERRVLETGSPVEGEETLRTAVGTRIFQAKAIALRDAQGRVAGLATVCADVTQRKLVEQSLRQAQQRLQIFVEHAPVALAMFDRDMCYLAASRRWLQDNGLDESVIGASHYRTFRSPVPEHWRDAHRRGMAGEVVRADEDSYPAGKGVVLWVRWEVRPWRDAAGAVGGIVIFAEDITELKRAQLAAEHSDARYRMLVDQSADALFVHDFQGRFVEVSQRACDSVGYTRAELLSMSVVDLEQDFDLARAQAALRSSGWTANSQASNEGSTCCGS